MSLLVIASVGLAACGGGAAETAPAAPAPAAAPASPEWQKVIDAARSEGTVSIYSTQPTDQLNSLAAAFKDTYGIQVETLRDVDANIESKVNAEKASNRPVADVLVTGDGAYLADKGPQGWWAKPAGPDFDGSVKVSDHDSFVVSAVIFVLGWNTQAIPGGLTSFQDLLKPELAGKVGIIDAAVSPAMVAFYDYVAKQTSPAYMDQLAAQRPQIFNSSLTAGQALISGQISAAIAVQPLNDEKAQGAPIDFLVPQPAFGTPMGTVVLANAPHPSAAQLLADFMVTPQGQAALARKAASALPDTPGAVTTIDKVDAFDPTKLTSSEIDQFRTEFRSKFQ